MVKKNREEHLLLLIICLSLILVTGYRPGFHDNTSFNDLVDEILRMKDFSHTNILTLMGVALDSRRYPCIVMPFMSNGSLVDYLRREDMRVELLWGEKAKPESIVSGRWWFLYCFFVAVFIALCYFIVALCV